MAKSVRTLLALSSFALVLPLAAYPPQFVDNQERTLNCDDHHGDWNQSRSCDIREQTIASTGSLHLDAGANGGVTVKGWKGSNVLVRAKVEAWGHSMSEAKSLASSVAVHSNPGDVGATGPQMHGGDGGWSVSYEVFVPHATNLTAKASNGGMHVSDIGGAIDVETVNGGLHLSRVAGDVKGETVNGGVHVDLMGDHWEGRGLNVSSTNGGVHLNVPQSYSAQFESSTMNGGIHSDIPELAPTKEHRGGGIQSVTATLGNGGSTVRATTVNGGVHIGHGGDDDR